MRIENILATLTAIRNAANHRISIISHRHRYISFYVYACLCRSRMSGQKPSLLTRQCILHRHVGSYLNVFKSAQFLFKFQIKIQFHLCRGHLCMPLLGFYENGSVVCPFFILRVTSLKFTEHQHVNFLSKVTGDLLLLIGVRRRASSVYIFF